MSNGGRQGVFRREKGCLPKGHRLSPRGRQRVSTGGRQAVYQRETGCFQEWDRGCFPEGDKLSILRDTKNLYLKERSFLTEGDRMSTGGRQRVST